MNNISKIARDAGDLARKLSAVIELSDLIKEIGDIDHHVRECKSRREKELSEIRAAEEKRARLEGEIAEALQLIESSKKEAKSLAEKIVSDAKAKAASELAKGHERLSVAKKESREFEDKNKALVREIEQRSSELEKLKGLIEKTKSAIAGM